MSLHGPDGATTTVPDDADQDGPVGHPHELRHATTYREITEPFPVGPDLPHLAR
jgi:hypothetical protein